MGLTESNQSKYGLWGPSKSSSTPHFNDRRYDEKPRHAATLPARSTPLSSKKNGRETSSSKRRGENTLSGVPQSRSPETERKKRKSDPLLDRLPSTSVVGFGRGTENGLHHAEEKPDVSPMSTNRQRPTAMYISDDQMDQFVTQSILNESDVETSHDVDCQEKETQTSPQGTLYRCPHEARSGQVKQALTEAQNATPVLGKKDPTRILSSSVPDKFSFIESEPYICLHYDSDIGDSGAIFNSAGQVSSVLYRPVMSEVSLFIPDEEEFCNSQPESQTSQIIINVRSLKKPAVGVRNFTNSGGATSHVQVSSNVWFESVSPSSGGAAPSAPRSKEGSPSRSSSTTCKNVSGSDSTEVASFNSFSSPSRISFNQPEANFSQVSFPCIDHGGELRPPSSFSSVYSTDLPRMSCNFPIKLSSEQGETNEEPRSPNRVALPNPSPRNNLSEVSLHKSRSRPSLLRNLTLKGPLRLTLHRDVTERINNLEDAKKYLFTLHQELDTNGDRDKSALCLLGSSEQEQESATDPQPFDGGTYPVLRLPKRECQPPLVDILNRAKDFEKKLTKESDSVNDVTNRIDSRIRPYGRALCGGAAPTSQKNGINFGIAAPFLHKEEEEEDCLVSSKFQDGKDLKGFQEDVDCSYTCHEQCQNVVSLDCSRPAGIDEAQPLLDDDDYADVSSCVDRLDSDSGVVDSADVGDGCPGEDSESEARIAKNRHNVELQKKDEEALDASDSDAGEEKHEAETQEKHFGRHGDLKEQHSDDHHHHTNQDANVADVVEVQSTLRRTVCRIQSSAVVGSEIEDWVERGDQGLQIAKESDGSFRGCLRIHLNLCRPINIVAGSKPPSIYDILQEDRTMEKTLTSFYMPRDAVKAIHITSTTTTREVIVALLRKFKVVDNPQKFALYEKTFETRQSLRGKLRKLEDNECPLFLAISWSAQGSDNKRLVMQENDTADIQWEAFSLPELDNFLKILDREEEEYKNQIKDKYSLLRKRIQQHLIRVHSCRS